MAQVHTERVERHLVRLRDHAAAVDARYQAAVDRHLADQAEQERVARIAAAQEGQTDGRAQA